MLNNYRCILGSQVVLRVAFLDSLEGSGHTSHPAPMHAAVTTGVTAGGGERRVETATGCH